MSKTYLAHHGVKGMKWGVRRYIDENGKLTDKGRKRYSGNHGIAKYVRDTNNHFRKNDRNYKILSAISVPLLGAKNSYDSHKKYGTTKNEIILDFITGTVLNGVGAIIGNQIIKNLNYRGIEQNPKFQNEMQRGYEYLKSQGINVSKPIIRQNNINLTQVAVNTGETFRQQQLMFDRQQRMGF